MPLNRKLLIAIVFVFLAIKAVFGINIFGTEMEEYNFPTYTQEVKGMVERGWLPLSMPKDVKDIKFVYDKDTNILNGSYSLKGLKEDSYFNEKVQVANKEALYDTKNDLTEEYNDIRMLIINDTENPNIYLGNKFVFAIYNDRMYFWMK